MPLLVFSGCTSIGEMVPQNTDPAKPAAALDEQLTSISEENTTQASETRIDIVVTSITSSEDVNTNQPISDNPPVSIALSFNEITLPIGEQRMPYVTMYPESADNKDEVWTSSDESVASVDGKGMITAVSAGSCTITVCSAVNANAYAEVLVTVEEPSSTDSSGGLLPKRIELSMYEITLEPGESKMPIVAMYPEECMNKNEVWTSSDENVATVDESGLITAKSKGNCTVTVSSAASPSVKAYVDVRVINAEDIEPTYIDGILIVNKSYPLPKSYGSGIDPDAQAAFDAMAAAAKDDGISLWIASGYRSYDYQQGLYDKYVRINGQEKADTFSARPGHSEHQTGLAFDLNIIDDSFAGTPEAEWIAAHCHEYGFIIRYPEGKQDITGYQYEPWHVRYLGKETAQKVYDSGLTLEEYLGIDSKYE